jgi:carboxymethylenebutenolidase
VTDAQITIDTADGPMPAFETSPGDDARGAVVVIQEAFGVTPHIEQVARRLSDAGWHAVAPALYHRQGAPVLAYGDLNSVGPVMTQLTAAGIETDIAATVDHLQRKGFAPAQIGIVGFCMGGSVTFYAASSHALGAAVTYYGGGVLEGRFGFPSLVERAPELKTPWLGLYGDLDKGISPEQVEQLRSAADAAPVPTEIVRYPDAEHGFNCDDRPAVFNAAAAADAWQHTLAWFDAHLQSAVGAQL